MSPLPTNTVAAAPFLPEGGTKLLAESQSRPNRGAHQASTSGQLAGFYIHTLVCSFFSCFGFYSVCFFSLGIALLIGAFVLRPKRTLE